MKAVRVLVAVVGVLVLGDAAAQAPAPAVASAKVLGVGARKCSEWNEWKEAKNGEARGVAVEWARGLISGHNVYARSGASQVSADATVVASLLDAYCEKRVDDAIFVAVTDLITRLGGTPLRIAPKKAAPGNPERKSEL